jgi:(2Fe-2S) ferredoxin
MDDTKPLDEERAAIEPDPPLFYSRHVFVCTNERPAGHPRGCCKHRGSEKLRDYMKARAKELGFSDVRINSAGCLDRCELGPTMVIYPEGVWYSPKSTADIDEILATHLGRGGRVKRLMLKPGDDPPRQYSKPGKPRS